jgi:hypothetical protein
LNQRVVLTSKNASTAIAYSPQHILITGPDAFTLYDYTTGQEQVLGSSGKLGKNTLANTDTVALSANKKYILFHDSLAPDNCYLYNQLNQQGDNAQSDYWWVYDVQANTFQHLPDSVLNAKMDGNTIYALQYGDGVQLASFDPATLKQGKTLDTLASVTDFAVANGGYLIQTYDSKLYFTSNGVINNQLSGNAEIAGVSSDKKVALITQTSSKGRSLIRIDLGGDNKQTTIADNVIDAPAVLQSANVAVYNTVQTGAYEFYNLTTGETRPISFSSKALPLPASRDVAPIKVAAALDAHTFIATDNNNAYWIIGNNLHGAK